MGYDGQGTIYIPLGEFHEFVLKYLPSGITESEIIFGAPRIRGGNPDIEIEYAFSTDTHPKDWAEPPAFLVVAKK